MMENNAIPEDYKSLILKIKVDTTKTSWKNEFKCLKEGVKGLWKAC